MSEVLNVNQSIDLLLSRAAKDQLELEVLIDESDDMKISFNQRELEAYNFSKSRCVGIRVLRDAKEGSAFSESLDDEDLIGIYEEAVTNSKFIVKNYEPEMFVTPEAPTMPEIYNKDLAQVSVEDKLDLAKRLEASALDKDERITAVPYNAYADTQHEHRIVNTMGTDLSYKTNICYMYSYALAKMGENSEMGLEGQIARSFKDLDPVKVGEGSAKKALHKLGAIRPKSGKSPILMHGEAVNQLLSLAPGLFSAQALDEKTSPLVGLLGKQIASPLIQIWDDPFYLAGPGARPFDGEGQASMETNLIENGVLKNVLTNSVYAKKMKLKKTNSASRTAKTELGISTSNLILKSGESTFEDLMAAHPQCMLIDSIKGFAGFNSVTGDFSMEAEGAFIEKGKETQRFSNFVVSGNLLSMLKDVEMVGDDPFFMSSPLVTPSLLISELSIAGQ